jgi:hypothetical protein
MAGFPNRIVRSSLGPTVIDTWPVKDERKAIPARTQNLQFWQVAGSQMCVPRACIGATVSGSVVTTDYQTLAWDTEGALALLTWGYASAGNFTFSFPNATYPDEVGNDVPLIIPFGVAHARALDSGSKFAPGQVVMTGPRAGTVRLWESDGSPYDVDFFMLLW